jgi:hypothetical protein
MALPCLPAAAALALALALAACGDTVPPGPETPEARHQSVAERLAGTWLREHTLDGIRVRRLMRLSPDGQFAEDVQVTDSRGVSTEHRHEGTWLYDGTNLKRKYTLMDGRPPSRLNVPFATFEIAFDSRNEFTGVDHVHGHKVHYRRVAPDTVL